MEKAKEIHTESMLMTVEAQNRGAFTPEYNVERELFEKDMKEIMEYSRDHIEAWEMNWILDDCRAILNFNLIKDYESPMNYRCYTKT